MNSPIKEMLVLLQETIQVIKDLNNTRDKYQKALTLIKRTCTPSKDGTRCAGPGKCPGHIAARALQEQEG